jgi:hypothetical protein
MSGLPHYLTVVGGAGLAAQVASLVYSIAEWRRQPWLGQEGRKPHRLWPQLALFGVGLVLPVVVATLVSRGRHEFIALSLGSQTPHWEAMTRPWEQLWALHASAHYCFPSLLLGMSAIAIGASAYWRDRLMRALGLWAVPGTVAPFLAGSWLFLHWSLQACDAIGKGSPAEDWAIFWMSMARARQALHYGAILALSVLLLAGSVAAYHLLRQYRLAARSRVSRLSLMGSVFCLVASAGLILLAEPMARENRSPWPHEDLQFSLQIVPPVPLGLSQADLYQRNGETRVGAYRRPLGVPLVNRVEENLSRWATAIELTPKGAVYNGQTITDVADLREHLEVANANYRLLHPREEMASMMVMATPDVPASLLSDALAVAFSLGSSEVRFVTAHPKSIYRPTFGPITYMHWQTTTVALAPAGDRGNPDNRQSIVVPGGYALYRDLLDAVFKREDSGSGQPLVRVGTSSPKK